MMTSENEQIRNDGGNAAGKKPTGKKPDSSSRRPLGENFRRFMTDGWAEPDRTVEPLASSRFTPARWQAIGRRFPGERLVFPAGAHKQRANDLNYAFRPNTSFAYFTGLGEDYDPDAVLVLDPVAPDSPEAKRGMTHTPALYLHQPADHTTRDFYMSAEYGEYWIGPRPGLAEFEAMTGIETHDLSQFADAVAKDVGAEGGVRVRVIREADQQANTAVDAARAAGGFDDPDANAADDAELHQACAEVRVIKDDYEIDQLRQAVKATYHGFCSVLRHLDEAVDTPRGERLIEGWFDANARFEGNTVGYDTIVASGDHAPRLHWMRNNGTPHAGDLLLMDAGVEVNDLYTADITRTFPLNGRFTPLQRRVYDAVFDAQQAAFDACRPGVPFSVIHDTVMRVTAEKLHELGLLPVSVEEALSPEGQQHRRWLACGVGHHLGLDCHDCAQARDSEYFDAELKPGMVFTIEPGLYFQSDDLLVPPEYRGIGVRIEDDVLMTEDGPEWLSSYIPRTADGVERWMEEMRGAAEMKGTAGAGDTAETQEDRR
ncbi:aminopeptidase P family protein [Bifidobacterium simiarum]|uniref:aminopeptidase P family protein n=1 Tax=Bifidobacterium simiarum TaxID=2045441 RepID=UPI001BDDC739|nr:aminopeptidase P family protein [Bifidobacterium simiarum]MBT1165952.1 aminopeptidase P family protein [Bifidobacterium simiarum]